MITKPPLGVMPESIWKEYRIIDLFQAIERRLKCYDNDGYSDNSSRDYELISKWSAEMAKLSDDLARMKTY